MLLVLLYIIFLELAREKEKLLIITQQFHYHNLSIFCKLIMINLFVLPFTIFIFWGIME